MIPESFDELSKVDTAAICTGIGAMGGALSYALKVEEGKPFRWTEFLFHCGISAFSGFIMYEFASYAGLPAGVAGAVCGVAGWAGTRMMRICEIVVRKKLGITREDMQGYD